MGCTMGLEREETLYKEAKKLGHYLCAAIDVLGEDLDRFSRDMTPDLREWGNIYKTAGRDLLIKPFEQGLKDIDTIYRGQRPQKFPDAEEQIRLCDSLTAALCNVMRYIEDEGKLKDCPEEISEWWKKHKVEDLRRESLQNTPHKKPTPY